MYTLNGLQSLPGGMTLSPWGGAKRSGTGAGARPEGVAGESPSAGAQAAVPSRPTPAAPSCPVRARGFLLPRLYPETRVPFPEQKSRGASPQRGRQGKQHLVPRRRPTAARHPGVPRPAGEPAGPCSDGCSPAGTLSPPGCRERARAVR